MLLFNRSALTDLIWIISLKISNVNSYVSEYGTLPDLQKVNFKRIFEPGFTTKKRGWGLGLSLSKRIIEDYHLGKLYVKSSSKQGTTFRISLHKN